MVGSYADVLWVIHIGYSDHESGPFSCDAVQLTSCILQIKGDKGSTAAVVTLGDKTPSQQQKEIIPGSREAPLPPVLVIHNQ